jgi:hypothetical protein
MGTLEINGETYEDLAKGIPAGSDPVDGTYYLLPPLGHPPRLGAAENEIMHVSFPGVDGVWRKKMGFRGRPIFIQLGTINSTKESVWGDVADLFTTFEQFERFTIKVPGLDLDGCALVPGGGEVMDEFALGGDLNRIIVLTSWQFRQYSFANA